MNIRRQHIFFIVLLLLFLSACNRTNPVSPTVTTDQGITETAIPSPTPTQTPNPPTATPIPLAAMVNGEGITMDEYMRELTQLQAAGPITGTNLASDPGGIVLDELINETLLAQSAVQNGFIVDDTMLRSRIDMLKTQLGGSEALELWITAHGYSNEDFEAALSRSIAAAWMRDQITMAVPQTADQVHIQQILLPNAGVADEVYASLQSGADFMKLASYYDPTTGGDLGWFPRGYLDEPAIEEAAFSLQPGNYSPVIQTEIGYHILYLLERDENHILLPDAWKTLQVNTIREWISEKRGQSDIQILLP